MKLGARVTYLGGKYVVVTLVDNDLACLNQFHYWNPWHLFGLLDLRICRHFHQRYESEWWHALDSATDE